MERLILIFSFSFIAMFSYSQQEQVILNNAVANYVKGLPKLENQAFKEFKKLDKSDRKPKKNEFNCYHFIIIPMFQLTEGFAQYHIGETNNFAQYIDFGKMHNDFEVFVFKNEIYKGSLHFSNFDNSYFSDSDTNMLNKSAFNGHMNLARQIMDFKPDMVFYPDCPLFLCFIKDGSLYIGRGEKQLQTVDYILPFDEFVKKNPLFIQELQRNKNPGNKRYRSRP